MPYMELFILFILSISEKASKGKVMGSIPTAVKQFFSLPGVERCGHTQSDISKKWLTNQFRFALQLYANITSNSPHFNMGKPKCDMT